MSVKSALAVLLFLYLELTGVPTVVTQAHICEDGWFKFNYSVTPNDSICIQVNTAPKSWQEAEAYCSESISNLIPLDDRNFSLIETGFESILLTVGDIMVNTYNLTEFWSGMYTSKEGRLKWDDYGPQYVREFHTWNWTLDHPDPTRGECGLTVLGTQQIVNSTIVDFNGAINVSLADCSRTLPFICKKKSVEVVVKPAHFCEDNWYGNQYVPVCNQIFLEPLPFQDARASCESQNGRLALAFSNFERKMIGAVYTYYELNDAYFASKNVDQLWVNQTNSTTPCAAYFRNLTLVGSVKRCDESHLYICTKPTRFLGYKIEGPSLGQEAVEFSVYQRLVLHGSLDRALYGDVFFLETPNAITNSRINYQQNSVTDWIGPITVKESDPEIAPYHVNVSLPTWTRLDRYVYYDIMLLTGFYTFGVYTINPPQAYRKAPPVLVRYPELGIYIYVAYIDFWQSAFEDSGKLSTSMIHKFNLLQNETILDIINENTGAMYNSSIFPAGSEKIAFFYSGKIEYVSTRSLKMRLFLPLWDRRNASTNLEQILMQIVKEHLKTTARYIVNPDTLVVRSTVTCPLTDIQRDGKNITFPSVQIGEQTFTWERCYPVNKALATAECKGDYTNGAKLENIKLADGCGVVPAYNQSTSTEFLKNLSETIINEQNFKQILNNTVNLTDPRVNLTEADIIYTANILYHYQDFDIRNTSSEVMDSVFSITNNILGTNPESIDLAQKIMSAGNRIIQSVDDLTNQVQLSDNDSLRFIRDFIASEVWAQDGSGDLVIGISLINTTATTIDQDSLLSVRRPDDADVMSAKAAIYLDENLVKGHRSRLTFHIYAKTGLFSTAENRFKINSKVAAARLRKNDRDIVQLGNDSVTCVFQVLEVNNNLVCSYWDYNADEGAGGWRTEGCNMTSYIDNTVICKCTHLTNFAVLIDLDGGSGISESNKLALGIITKVGLSISIFGLGLNILTFLMFRHLRKGRGQQVLINLSVSMVCSAILFLVGMERTESRGGCIAVAALLHYFILVSFMWMLVEGILQYLRFVKVLGTYVPKFMLKTMIPAWGIPLIPVIILLALDYDMYYGGKGYCWLSEKPLLYAFIIPIAFVIFANLVVFTLVMCKFLRRKKNIMISNQSERKMAFLHFQAAVSIFVILGLTWVFGFMTVDDTRIVFHYLFAIFNAFQGLFVFLFFTLREKKIRNAWRKLCCPRSVYKSTTSSDEHKGKTTNSDTKSIDLVGNSSNSTGLPKKRSQSCDIEGNSSNKTVEVILYP